MRRKGVFSQQGQVKAGAAPKQRAKMLALASTIQLKGESPESPESRMKHGIEGESLGAHRTVHATSTPTPSRSVRLKVFQLSTFNFQRHVAAGKFNLARARA